VKLTTVRNIVAVSLAAAGAVLLPVAGQVTDAVAQIDLYFLAIALLVSGAYLLSDGTGRARKTALVCGIAGVAIMALVSALVTAGVYVPIIVAITGFTAVAAFQAAIVYADLGTPSPSCFASGRRPSRSLPER
jgi:hypothetical protein